MKTARAAQRRRKTHDDFRGFIPVSSPKLGETSASLRKTFKTIEKSQAEKLNFV